MIILTHGYMPDAFMKTSIISILKNKTAIQVLKTTTDQLQL